MSLGHSKKNRLRRRFLAPLLCFCLLMLSLFFVSCGKPANGLTEGDRVPGEGNEVHHNRFSFLVCGDPHGRTDLLEKIAAQAREGEFLVVLGDLTTGKSIEEMRTMKKFLDSTGLFYYVIPGDNDMPQGSVFNFWSVFGADYYSLDVQDSHLVFLNNAVIGVGCPPRELSWLRQDLAGAEGKLVIAFAHVPPGAPVDITENGFVPEETESNREMKEILAAAGASVIYCGHIHAYLLYSSGPPRIVVTGGAGAKPHLSEESGGFHHFLRVTVEDDQVREEVIPL